MAKLKHPPPPQQEAPSAPAGAEAQVPADIAASGSGPSIEDLLSALNKHAKDSKYRQVVKTADQILEIAPDDPDALRCKVVALIQDGTIDDALTVIESVPSSVADLSFEKAYCLYRKNMLVEALDILKGKDPSESILQLEAQILYRKGALDLAISSYKKLSEKFKIDSEVKTNLLAAYVSGERSNEVLRLMDDMKLTPQTSFEIAYNAACALIDAGDLKKAEDYLLIAYRIGEEALLEDDYSRDEVDDELAPVSVQLAYVKQIQGYAPEALERYKDLVEKKITDLPSMAVASNNLAAIRGTKDLSDSLKKFEKLLEKNDMQFSETLKQKLSVKQKDAILVNYFLLVLSSNKWHQAFDLIPTLVDRLTDSNLPILLHASLLCKDGKLNKAEELLQKHVNEYSGCSTDVKFMQAQVTAYVGRHRRAAECLQRISEFQYKPGMIMTIVALKDKGGDSKGAEAVLDDAVDWWSNHMGEDFAIRDLLTQKAAQYKLKHKNYKDAANLFERLTNTENPRTKLEALNGLILSTAETDIIRAEAYEKQLPPVPGLSALNVEKLEQTGLSSGSIQTTFKDELVMEISDKGKNKRKRKKKPRYPKGFDPANPGPPPDPERWLPKRERSSFKPKRKDKRAQLKGSQGAVAKEPVANGPKQASTSSSSKAVSEGKSAASQASQRKNKKSRR